MLRLLLLGESAGSARYLTGAFDAGGHQLRHVEARQPLDRLEEPCDVVIISDYPAARLGAAAAAAVVAAVEGGAGLIMIGGWSSFTGAGGNWGASPLARLLPVVCAAEDDRRNVASGLWLEAAAPEHPLLRGLDLAAPPVVCGYNEVGLAEGASLIARGRHVRFGPGAAGELAPSAGAAVPLLALGPAGKGRTVAYMSDLVPHWCGGIVDWGGRRQRLSSGAEVGDGYVTFLLNLVAWAAGEEGDTATAPDRSAPGLRSPGWTSGQSSPGGGAGSE